MVWIGSVMLGTQGWKTFSQKTGSLSASFLDPPTAAVPAPVHRLLLALHGWHLDLGLSSWTIY